MGSVNIPVSALMDRYQDRLTRGLADAGQVVVDEVRRTIREPKSGVHWPGFPNRSSAPGETPAHQFGGLNNGLVVDANESRADVTSYAPYSAYLEYGTINMAPRAFMRPSLVLKYDKIVETIAGAISGK